MARISVRLEGFGTFEPTVVYELLVGSAVQQQLFDFALPATQQTLYSSSGIML